MGNRNIVKTSIGIYMDNGEEDEERGGDEVGKCPVGYEDDGENRRGAHSRVNNPEKRITAALDKCRNTEN